LPLGTTPRGIIQGGLNALPMAGMVAGGAVGTAAEPGAGSLVGAGLGSAGGEALKNLGEQYILGQDKTRADIYGNVAKAGVEGAAAEAGGKLLGKGIEAAANTKLGQAVIDKVGQGASKLASTFTGVPQKEIQTYAKHAAEIDKLAASSDNDAQEMADQLRQKMNTSIQDTRKGLNAQISKALESAPKNKNIDVTPIIDSLEDYKQRLDPSLHADAIKDVDSLIDKIKGSSPSPAEKPVLAYDAATEMNARVKGAPYDQRITELTPGEVPNRLKNKVESVPVVMETKPGDAVFPKWTTDKTGNWVQQYPEDRVVEIPTGGKGPPKYLANIQTLQKIKQFLGDQAAGAFGGTPLGFQVGKQAANAAKQGFQEAKGLMDTIGPREISEANAALSKLHEIQDVANKSMLAEGKTASSLYAAGSGANPANAKVLKQLGEATGTDMLGDAEKIATARTFGKPSLLPVDATGKSLTRMGAAGAAGYLVGHIPGALIAEGLASPAAVKAGINAGTALGRTAAATMKVAPSLAGKAAETFLPKGDSTNPAPDQKTPVTPDNSPMQLNKDRDTPTKGPKKWANDGLQNLIDHANDPKEKQTLQSQKGAMIDDPKLRDLLVQASDLKPGSKAMDNLMSKVKSRLDDKGDK